MRINFAQHWVDSVEVANRIAAYSDIDDAARRQQWREFYVECKRIQKLRRKTLAHKAVSKSSCNRLRKLNYCLSKTALWDWIGKRRKTGEHDQLRNELTALKKIFLGVRFNEER
jgi:hypothetical protein